MDGPVHTDYLNSRKPRGLEVISAESFQFRRQRLGEKQLQSAEFCAGCVKERENLNSMQCDNVRQNSSFSTFRSHRQVHKSKAPIVIPMPQAIEKALSNRRYRKLRNSCEIDSASSTDTEEGQSVVARKQRTLKSCPGKHVKAFNKHNTASRDKCTKCKEISTTGDFRQLKTYYQKKSNVSCLNINQSKKPNVDLSKLPVASAFHEDCIHGNVSPLTLQTPLLPAQVNRKTYSEVAAPAGKSVLNNLSIPAADSAETRKLNNLENIKVVCNDLHGTSTESGPAQPVLEPYVEKELSSESSSLVTSDSESVPDTSSSDDSEEGGVPDKQAEDLSRYNLQSKLPGISTVTSSAKGHRIPRSTSCAKQFTHYFAQDSEYLHIEVLDHPDQLGPNDQAVDSRKPRRYRTLSEHKGFSTEHVVSEEPHMYTVTEISPTEVQVSLAKSQKRVRTTSAPNITTESKDQVKNFGKFKHVSIDLTNTGWTYTIDYPATKQKNRGISMSLRSSQSQDVDISYWQNMGLNYMYGCPAYNPSSSVHELSFKQRLQDQSHIPWQNVLPLVWMPYPYYPHMPVYFYPVVPVPYPFGPSIVPPWAYPTDTGPVPRPIASEFDQIERKYLNLVTLGM